MKLFGKKKVKVKGKDEDNQTISSNSIRIKIFMRFGAEIRQKRLEFIALERRDEYNNLVMINQDFDYNEDSDFTQQDIYSALNTTLGLKDLGREAANKNIDSEIETTEKKIKALEKHPELSKYANIWDLTRKLRMLKVFKNYLNYRSPNGAYFYIENGLRVYEYESIDGFLIPIWKGADDLTDYPDYTRNKKITMQETATIKDYFSSRGAKKIVMNGLIVFMIINLVFFGINVWGGFKLLDKHQDLENRIVGPYETCTRETAETARVCNDVLQSAVVSQYKKEIEGPPPEEESSGPSDAIVQRVTG